MKTRTSSSFWHTYLLISNLHHQARWHIQPSVMRRATFCCCQEQPTENRTTLQLLYADIRKKLPPASGMDLTTMRQVQGAVVCDDITRQPLLLDVDSPLYKNCRCSAGELLHKLPKPHHIKLHWSVSACSIPCHSLTCIWQSSLYMQVPISNFWQVSASCRNLCNLASWDFVHKVCAQARYYYASEATAYQPVMCPFLSGRSNSIRCWRKLNARFGINGQW